MSKLSRAAALALYPVAAAGLALAASQLAGCGEVEGGGELGDGRAQLRLEFTGPVQSNEEPDAAIFDRDALTLSVRYLAE
jgi:hypothetical protein